MNDVKVKICGLMEPEVALEAEKNGADYIGIVFCKKSKRCVSIEDSLKILNVLKASTKKVALFANDDADYIAKVLNKTNFTQIQFHGNEIDEDCIKYNLQYIRGISYTNNDSII